MKKSAIICFMILLNTMLTQGQSIEYQNNKLEKINNGSVFTKIINRELPATIVYEDDDVISFVPIRQQARVHLLIVPKKEIYTINDISETDTMLLGKMMQVAKILARENGIDQTGYRLSINVNEDAGQSVFHIHMHLLGGNKLGPMVDRID